ncbi:MAG: hypothetical protein AAGH68_15415 [Pseudomonadota bacterium]
MRTLIAVLLVGATATGAAHAQSQPFQGIAGELPKVTTEEDAGTRSSGLAFEIDRGRNRELEKATGIVPVGQQQFYRPSILTGQRARRTSGTGIPIFDKLFTLD